MQREPGLVEEQDSVVMRITALHEKNEIKAQEPLKARAAAFQFDIFGAEVVGDPNAEMIAVCLEAKTIGALLPPVAELACELRRRGLQQHVPFFLPLSSRIDLC